jgi:predicted RNA methylase
MAQRFSGYDRQKRESYPTPRWVTELLIPHLPRDLKEIWEPAAGNGVMAAALREGTGARVYASDIKPMFWCDVFSGDFFKYQCHPIVDAERPQAIITNPPYGVQGREAEAFIEHALTLMAPVNGFVAMLLKVDFDSAKGRDGMFASCPAWSKKLVLRKRIMWFPSESGHGPSDNHAWFLWDWAHQGPPTIAYAP